MIEVLCGFEYVDGTNGGGVWFDRTSGGATFGTTYSRHSGQRGMTTTNGEHGVGWYVDPASTKVLGFACQPQAVLAEFRSLAGFAYGGEYQVDVVLHDKGSGNAELIFYRGSAATGAGGTIIATSPIFDRTIWNYFEIRLTTHASTGRIEVLKNAVAFADFTSLNTVGSSRGAGISRISTHGGLAKFGGVNSNWAVYYDDVYIDTADFLGVLRIAPKGVPTGAGTYTQWTPSAGSNYQTVDEIPENSTDYNSSATAGQIDSFTFGALGLTGTVLGVSVLAAAARATGDGARRLAPFARLSGTDLAGTGRGVPDSDYWNERYRGILLTKPGGGGWTVSDVDSAEFGYKLDAATDPRDPSALGAVHWWRADSNVTLTSGRVSAWGDKIGSANWGQTNASFRPVVASAHINGHDAIRFTALSSELLELADPLVAAGFDNRQYDVFFVVRLVADPPAVAAATGLHNWFTSSPGANYPWTDGIVYEAMFGNAARLTVGNWGPSMTAYHTYNVLYRTGDETGTLCPRRRFWFSGQKQFGNEVHVTYAAPATWRLGQNHATGYLDGWLAEVVIFPRELHPGERASFLEYVQSRYAIFTPTSATVRVTQVGVEVALQTTAPPSTGSRRRSAMVIA